MSSATLRFERFVSRSCSASLTPWLSLFYFSESVKSELNRSILATTVKTLKEDCEHMKRQNNVKEI